MIPRGLTVGASDSSGAAGIQADLKTFEARQGYGLSAIVALNAQNSLGIQSLQLMDAQFILEQIRAMAEFGPGAVKTGLLFRSELVERVGRAMPMRRASPTKSAKVMTCSVPRESPKST